MVPAHLDALLRAGDKTLGNGTRHFQCAIDATCMMYARCNLVRV